MAIIFSIVVPVYNVENYLEKCINSIIHQNFKNYELILINDGSTDSSCKICENFATNFEQINYINQKNSGVASARNKGIQLAQGDYVIFVDSDDFLCADNALKEIYNLIIVNNSPDLILHEAIRLAPNGTVEKKNNTNSFIGKDNFIKEFKNLVYSELYNAVPWNKIIKREILIHNNLYFPENVKAEDAGWCAELLGHIKTFTVYQNPMYTYRKYRDNSLSSSINIQSLMDVYTMINKSIMNVSKCDDLLKNMTLSFWGEHYCSLLIYYSYFKNSPKEVKSNIKKLTYILKTQSTKSVSKLYKLYRIVGFDMAIFILSKYMFIRNMQKRRKNFN